MKDLITFLKIGLPPGEAAAAARAAASPADDGAAAEEAPATAAEEAAQGIFALEAAIQEALAAGVDPGDVSSAQSRLQEMTKEQQQQDDETMSSLYKMTSEEHSLDYSEERRTSLL